MCTYDEMCWLSRLEFQKDLTELKTRSGIYSDLQILILNVQPLSSSVSKLFFFPTAKRTRQKLKKKNKN